MVLLVGKGAKFYCANQILSFIMSQVPTENTWATVQILVEINKLKVYFRAFLKPLRN